MVYQNLIIWSADSTAGPQGVPGLSKPDHMECWLIQSCCNVDIYSFTTVLYLTLSSVHWCGIFSHLYPEWPHRQGGCLVCWRLQDGIPAAAELHRFMLFTRRSGGTAHEGRGCDQPIGFTFFDTTVRSWLWSTATRSSPLGYFSNYCK